MFYINYIPDELPFDLPVKPVRAAVWRKTDAMPKANKVVMFAADDEELVIDEKRDNITAIPLGGAANTLIEPLTNLLSFLQAIKIA